MAQSRLESNHARRLAGGSSLTIVRRWPAPLVERRLAAGTARWAALLDEQDADHDGWQPIRLRHDEEQVFPKQTGAGKRLGLA